MSLRRTVRALAAVTLLLATTVVAAPLIDPAGAAPAVRIWDGAPDGEGTSPDQNWTTAANWVGDTAPIAGDILEFPNVPGGTQQAHNDFPPGTAFSALRFTWVEPGAVQWTVSGNGIVVTDSVGSSQLGATVALPVALGAPVALDVANQLTLSQPLDLAGHAATVTGNGFLHLEGLTGSAPAPGVTVAMGAEGQMRLDGPSSYTGAVRVTSGTLDRTGWGWGGSVTIDGGTFTGMGDVGAVTATSRGGVLAPGSSLKAASVNLDPSTTLAFADGAQFHVSGPVHLNGAALRFSCLSCTSYGTARTVVDMAPGSALTGTFAGLPELARFEAEGAWWEISYRWGTDGNDVQVRRVEGPHPPPPPPPPPAPSGYWMLGSTGQVWAFGEVAHHGDRWRSSEAVDLEPTPTGQGYWVLYRDGTVLRFGDANWLGNAPAADLRADEHVMSLSATPDGGGYWVFTTAGRVLPFGNARHFGDVSHLRLNGPVLDSVATPSGAGYYMVAADGGIFALGDAVFRGSMGGKHLNAAVQSLVPDHDNDGYWLVASDGGIFSFDAPFRGSMGGVPLNKPVVGMVRFGDGYLMVGADGGIFSFSDKPFYGSLGDSPPPFPIVAVAASG